MECRCFIQRVGQFEWSRKHFLFFITFFLSRKKYPKKTSQKYAPRSSWKTTIFTLRCTTLKSCFLNSPLLCSHFWQAFALVLFKFMTSMVYFVINGYAYIELTFARLITPSKTNNLTQKKSTTHSLCCRNETCFVF